MKEVEIHKIESSLSCKLPKGYRKFLLNRGEEVAELKELLPLRVVLWMDPDEIIDENQSARKYADDKPIGKKRNPWPDHYFLVGTNGAGDYWFIDLSGELRGIWSYQHEAEDVEQHYDNFGEWMGDLRRDAKRPEDWQ